jgi:hypothetical protein
MNDKRKYATAIHEAGHCVVNHLLGDEVMFVTIHNCDGNGMTTVGNSSDENSVIGGFAGPWAQKLFSDEPPTLMECSDDYDQINRILGISSAHHPRVALRERLKEKSREMVIAHEKQIRAVADLLSERGYLGFHWDDGAKATETLNVLVGVSHKRRAA